MSSSSKEYPKKDGVFNENGQKFCRDIFMLFVNLLVVATIYHNGLGEVNTPCILYTSPKSYFV